MFVLSILVTNRDILEEKLHLVIEKKKYEKI